MDFTLILNTIGRFLKKIIGDLVRSQFMLMLNSMLNSNKKKFWLPFTKGEITIILSEYPIEQSEQSENSNSDRQNCSFISS